MPETNVTAYIRHTKEGKLVHVSQYKRSFIGEFLDILEQADGKPPVAAQRGSHDMTSWPGGRTGPSGMLPNPKILPKAPPSPAKKAPSQKRFATRAEDARLLQGQTQGHFANHTTGASMGKTEIGDTYEQMFMQKFAENKSITDRYGKPELVTGAGRGTARNTPLDFATPTHGGELKTLNINSKNQKTAIKAAEIQRKMDAIDDRGLKPLLLVQVVDQDSGTVHVYGYEQFASKAVSKMEHLGSYKYDQADFERAQEASGHASKAAGRAEAQRRAAAKKAGAAGVPGSGAVGRGGRRPPTAKRGQQPSPVRPRTGRREPGGAAKKAVERPGEGGGVRQAVGPPEKPMTGSAIHNDAGLQMTSEATERDLPAILSYTGGGYRHINNSLRDPSLDLDALYKKQQENFGYEQPMSIADAAEMIDHAIASTDGSTKPFVVYRGIAPEGNVEVFPKALEPGSVITDNGFVSTSSDRQVAENFAMNEGDAIIEIHAPKGTKAALPDQAVALSGESAGEDEVIMARGSQFRVVSDTGPSLSGTRRIVVDLVPKEAEGGKQKATAKQAGKGAGVPGPPHVEAGGHKGYSAAAGEQLFEGPGKSNKVAVVKDGKVIKLVDKDTGEDASSHQGLWNWNQKLKQGKLKAAGQTPAVSKLAGKVAAKKAVKKSAAKQAGPGVGVPGGAGAGPQPAPAHKGVGVAGGGSVLPALAPFVIGPGLRNRVFGNEGTTPPEGVKRAIADAEARVPGHASMLDHVATYPHDGSGVVAQYLTYTQLKAKGLKGPGIEIYMKGIKQSNADAQGTWFVPGGDGSKSLDNFAYVTASHEFGHSVYTLLTRDQKAQLHRLAAQQLGKHPPPVPSDLGSSAAWHKETQAFSKLMTDNRSKIKNDLSVYGASKRDEFFAECWAEYSTNPNCRPLAKAVGEQMERFAHQNHGEGDEIHGAGTGFKEAASGSAVKKAAAKLAVKKVAPTPVKKVVSSAPAKKAAPTKPAAPTHLGGPGGGPGEGFGPAFDGKIKPGDTVYKHPVGSIIVVHPDGSLDKYSASGKPVAKTSASAEKLAAGHGQWKKVDTPSKVTVHEPTQAPGFKPDTPAEAIVTTPKPEPEIKSTPAPPSAGKHHVPMIFNEAPLSDVPKYIADDNWFFQQKVDGIRSQLVIEGGKKPWFRSKSGDKSASSTSAKTLDPILKLLGDGIPDGGASYAIDGEALDGKWYVFDLTVGDKDKTPWEERMARADAWVKAMNDAGIHQIVALPTARTKAEKEAMFKAVRDNGGEGVMMKRKDAPYDYDHRVNHTLKAKFVSTADVVVTELNPGGKDSVNIAMHDENGNLVSVGTVSKLGKEKQAGIGKLQVGDVIEVAYLYATPNNTVYQPRIVKKRPDKQPKQSKLEQLRKVNKEVLDSGKLNMSGKEEGYMAPGEGALQMKEPPKARAAFRAVKKGGGVHHGGAGVSLSSTHRLILRDLIMLTNSTQQAWEDAAAAGINHVLLVLKNNPASSVENALQRPDVKEAIDNAGSEGAKAVMADLEAVWSANGGDPNSPYLVKLLQDAQANGNVFADRVTPALIANDHAAAKQIMMKERLRAGAAGDVAESKAKSEAVLAEIAAKGGGQVRWRAHLDNKTCAFCLALDGQVTHLGSAFPAPVGLTPYLTLTGPPAHPNCRCYVEAV